MALKSKTAQIAALLRISKMNNGITVASAEPDAPVSRVGVIVKAGSRYERNDQRGITHYLRLLSSQSALRMTPVGLARSTEQMGGNIVCTSHREYLMYSAHCLPDHAESCIDNLRQVVTTPAFKPWEITDAQPYIEYDLALLRERPNIKCLEMVVEAAYRDTVGRSLYMPEANINRFKSEDLMEYVRANFTEGNIAVSSLGVDHATLTTAVEKFQAHPRVNDDMAPGKYYGGELRLHSKNPLVYAAVCTEGVGFGNREAYPAWILQGIMGTGPHLKWSEGNMVSRLGQAIARLHETPVNSMSSIDINYSDCGLFGFMVAAESHKIRKFLGAACEEYCKLLTESVTDEEVEMGKKKATAALYMGLEESECKLLDMGDQLLWNGQVMPMQDVAAQIDAVTTAEVNAFAKKSMTGRWSMSAVGDLTDTPYLGDIKK